MARQSRLAPAARRLRVDHTTVSLLEKRFGGVSPQLRQRIFSADVLTLEKWVERVLDAQDLQSVFESPRRHMSHNKP